MEIFLSDNLVTFPSGKKTGPSLEKVNEALDSYRSEVVDDITDAFANDFTKVLAIAGFDFEDDSSIEKETYLFVESLRALIAKKMGEKHPYHELADKAFSVSDKGEVTFHHPTFEFVNNPSGT